MTTQLRLGLQASIPLPVLQAGKNGLNRYLIDNEAVFFQPSELLMICVGLPAQLRHKKRTNLG